MRLVNCCLDMAPILEQWILLLFAPMLLCCAGQAAASLERPKRLVPVNQKCNPTAGTCAKGDFVDKNIADCKYDRFLGTCTASGETGGFISWVVAPDAHNRCKPVSSGKHFRCGVLGSNTRCVCSDYKIQFNECRCQYWTEDTPGEHDPAFCVAYYLGGDSGVHHYACCNNCRDSTPQDCDSHTYQGGSSGDYCDSCGKATGGKLQKYLFNCGSCEVQAACEHTCNRHVGDVPGLCWKWVDCFRGCCSAASTGQSTKRLDTTEIEFCGDGRCTAPETFTTCPTDCCYNVNSVNCTNAVGTCIPACCQMPTCCIPPNSTTILQSDDERSRGSVLNPVLLTWGILTMLSTFLIK